jgi:hypothetical protein
MSRPIVMEFSRGPEYKTMVVISDYDSISYHGTELPETATPELISRFFIEAERAATKQFEQLYDDASTLSKWEEVEPDYNRYAGG